MTSLYSEVNEDDACVKASFSFKVAWSPQKSGLESCLTLKHR